MAPSTHRLDVFRPATAPRVPAGREAGRLVAPVHRLTRLLVSDRVLPYLLVAPAVLLVFALTIYPTL
jgi:hypothetical protein